MSMKVTLFFIKFQTEEQLMDSVLDIIRSLIILLLRKEQNCFNISDTIRNINIFVLNAWLKLNQIQFVAILISIFNQEELLLY